MQRKVKGPHAHKKKPQNPVHPGFFLVTPLVLVAVATAWPWPNLYWPWDSIAVAQSTQATDAPDQNLLQELTTMKQDINELKTLLKNLVTRVDELDERTAAIVHIENVTRMVETQAATMQSLTTLAEKIDGVAKIAQVEVLTARVDALEKVKKEQVMGLTTRVTKLGAAASSVVFSAMIKHENTFNSGEKVIFSQVQTNEGDDYDNTTGIFTARIKGLYFFTVTIHTHGGDIDLYVYKNEEDMSQLYNPTAGYHGSETSSLVMPLESGDTVYVKAYKGRVQSYTQQSMFSGFLIHPM
ncbi:uncharacterized protein LOC129167898 isoform X2 [Dunckerocampus dactyliophorus]|nr:uncharacterized protein LOC129167898 isoform X2 [Dunckerocampus dactyliophorus]XP_054608558.1 uncharacterized protein LOC129167898 isoform X2 [Dunckerocampus dactyliophorus]XP_054608559.1 uncharacterized protein LOC129167898 isoform X2 [Dunckerocampus dactyliophorus]